MQNKRKKITFGVPTFDKGRGTKSQVLQKNPPSAFVLFMSVFVCLSCPILWKQFVQAT